MKNSSMQKATAKANTNFSRIRKALDGMDNLVRTERECVYYCVLWGRDEKGDEVLVLWNEGEDGGSLTFSKEAIKQATIDGNSVTMTDKDGQEHVLNNFSVKAARL